MHILGLLTRKLSWLYPSLKFSVLTSVELRAGTRGRGAHVNVAHASILTMFKRAFQTVEAFHRRMCIHSQERCSLEQPQRAGFSLALSSRVAQHFFFYVFLGFALRTGKFSSQFILCFFGCSCHFSLLWYLFCERVNISHSPRTIVFPLVYFVCSAARKSYRSSRFTKTRRWSRADEMGYCQSLHCTTFIVSPYYTSHTIHAFPRNFSPLFPLSFVHKEPEKNRYRFWSCENSLCRGPWFPRLPRKP